MKKVDEILMQDERLSGIYEGLKSSAEDWQANFAAIFDDWLNKDYKRRAEYLRILEDHSLNEGFVCYCLFADESFKRRIQDRLPSVLNWLISADLIIEQIGKYQGLYGARIKQDLLFLATVIHITNKAFYALTSDVVVLSSGGKKSIKDEITDNYILSVQRRSSYDGKPTGKKHKREWEAKFMDVIGQLKDLTGAKMTKKIIRESFKGKTSYLLKDMNQAIDTSGITNARQFFIEFFEFIKLICPDKGLCTDEEFYENLGDNDPDAFGEKYSASYDEYRETRVKNILGLC